VYIQLWVLQFEFTYFVLIFKFELIFRDKQKERWKSALQAHCKLQQCDTQK